MNRNITILVAAEHLLVRQAWSSMLNTDLNIGVIGLAGTVEEALQKAAQLNPDILVFDMSFQRMGEIEAVAMAKQDLPQSKILVISTNTNPAYIRTIMQNGALGYITKNTDSSELFQAIKEIHEGGDYICAEIKNKLAEIMIIGKSRKEGIDLLSSREIEIIGHIKNGKSSKEIAEQLNITLKTIQVHRYNILKKLNLKNAAAMVNYINNTHSNNNHFHTNEKYTI
jgi:two-component system invasion response regulator UvrY